MPRALVVLAVLAPPALAACRSPLLEPPPAWDPAAADAGPAGALRTQPEAAPEGLPPVFRLRVAGVPLEALRVYTGVLSDYHAGRVVRGEPPATLEERAVPFLGWSDAETGEAVAAPRVVLPPGEPWTVAELGVGVLGVLMGAPDPGPVWERRWPAEGVPARVAVHCGPGPEPRLAAPASAPDAGTPATSPPASAPIPGDQGWLDPVGAPVGVLSLGTDGAGGGCVALVAGGRVEGEAVPPLTAPEGAALAPSPLVLAPAPADGPPCAAGEIAVPHACATVEDDRVRLRARHAALFLGDTVQRPTPEAAGGEWLRRGLAPEAPAELTVWALDLGGAVREQRLAVTTLAARPRLRLSEVLANAVGAEPAMEWVEIVNDGAAPASLGGVTLVDTGTATPLPEGELAPGEIAVVVSEAFLPGPFDQAPAPGARLLRVPALGKAGLSNAGEPLALVAADGTVLDAFPGLPADEPGVSWARLDPDLPAVALHAAPGASPGAPNRCR